MKLLLFFWIAWSLAILLNCMVTCYSLELHGHLLFFWIAWSLVILLNCMVTCCLTISIDWILLPFLHVHSFSIPFSLFFIHILSKNIVTFLWFNPSLLINFWFSFSVFCRSIFLICNTHWLPMSDIFHKKKVVLINVFHLLNWLCPCIYHTLHFIFFLDSVIYVVLNMVECLAPGTWYFILFHSDSTLQKRWDSFQVSLKNHMFSIIVTCYWVLGTLDNIYMYVNDGTRRYPIISDYYWKHMTFE